MFIILGSVPGSNVHPRFQSPSFYDNSLHECTCISVKNDKNVCKKENFRNVLIFDVPSFYLKKLSGVISYFLWGFILEKYDNLFGALWNTLRNF